jgi:hypothetical protein
MSFACGEDTNCIELSFDGATLTADLIISPAPGNAAVCTETGLFVPGGALSEGVLPDDPASGQDAYFVASDAEGVVWHLKYRDDSASIYRWEWCGGSELRNKVDELETYVDATPAAGYVNLPGGTIGPDLVLPLAGDYIITMEALIDGAADGTLTSASVRVGADAAVFDDAIANYADRYVSVSRTRRINGIAASTTIRMQYHKESASTAQFGHRLLAARPVRVKAP